MCNTVCIIDWTYFGNVDKDIIHRWTAAVKWWGSIYKISNEYSCLFMAIFTFGSHQESHMNTLCISFEWTEIMPDQKKCMHYFTKLNVTGLHSTSDLVQANVLRLWTEFEMWLALHWHQLQIASAFWCELSLNPT